MKIIISPVKVSKVRKLKEENIDYLFESKKNALVSMMKEKSIEELKSTWRCSGKIAEESYRLYKSSDVSPKGYTIRGSDGIQCQYMDVDSLDREKLEYLEEHLRILSGFYGVLRPSDQVLKYRLGFEDKSIDLYEFWEDEIKNHFEGEEIISLVSKKYGQSIYKCPDKTPVKIELREEVLVNRDIKLKIKATPLKILRGRMVNCMIRNHIENTKQLKKFSCDEYGYSEKSSDKKRLVFVKSLVSE